MQRSAGRRKPCHQMAGTCCARLPMTERSLQREEEKTFCPFSPSWTCQSVPLSPFSPSPGPLCAAGTGLGTAQFPRLRRSGVQSRSGSRQQSERTQSLPAEISSLFASCSETSRPVIQTQVLPATCAFPFSCSSSTPGCFYRRRRCPPRGTLLTCHLRPPRPPPATSMGQPCHLCPQ